MTRSNVAVRGAAFFGAFLSFLLLAAAAPAAGASGADKDKSLQLFLGYAAGSDSNVIRAEDAEDDTFTEALVGLRLKRGNGRNRFDLLAQYRGVQYADSSEYDLTETMTRVAAGMGAEKARFFVDAEYSLLADPVDIALTQVLERTKTAYAPRLDLAIGNLDLLVAYSVTTLDYDARDDLDYDDTAMNAELSFGKKGAGNQFFLHVDAGTLNFTDASSSHPDFSYQRAYLGWRDEKDGNWGMELGVGQKMSNLTGAAQLDSDTSAYTKLRFTKLLSGGRSGVELLFVQDTEPAATAELKKVSRACLNYSQKANDRLSWIVGVKSETEDYLEPDVSMSVLGANVGLNLDIGSPQKMRGRVYLAAGFEQRSGDTSNLDYERTLMRFGFALVY